MTGEAKKKQENSRPAKVGTVAIFPGTSHLGGLRCCPEIPHGPHRSLFKLHTTSFVKRSKPQKRRVCCCSKNFLSLLKVVERRKETSENPGIGVKPVDVMRGWTCTFFPLLWLTDIWVSLRTYVCL